MLKILCLLLLPLSLYAETVHMAQLKAEKELRPLQILGTVKPPTLIINGKKHSLARKKDTTDKPSVWINEKEILAEGEHGRFFKELTLQESAVQSLVVLIKTSKRAYETKIHLKRLFLEAALAQQKTNKDQTSFEFQLTGLIPANSQLAVEGAKVEVSEDNLATVTLTLPQGRSIIAARLESEGTTQIFNIPVQVTIETMEKPTPTISEEKVEIKIANPYFLSTSLLNQSWFYSETSNGLQKTSIPPLELSAGYFIKSYFSVELGYEYFLAIKNDGVRVELMGAHLLVLDLNWSPFRYIELGLAVSVIRTSFKYTGIDQSKTVNYGGTQVGPGSKLGVRIPIWDRLELTPHVHMLPVYMGTPLQGLMKIDILSARYFF